MKKTLIIESVLVLLLFLLAGCFQWNPKYLEKDLITSFADSNILLEKAELLAKKADTPEKLKGAMKAYEDVLDVDSLNYEALTYLSTFNLLMGDGYAKSKREKCTFFRAAMDYSAQAMYTNPDFKRQIDEGAELWEAIEALSIHEMGAMFFWTTGVFYYYKEGLGPMAQVINYRWVKRAKMVMEKMKRLDPEWGGGGIYFMWALYYLSLPESVGGDRNISEEYFDKAVAAGPDWLMNRWGRAKYYCIKMKKKNQFEKDLKWVLAQDIEKCRDHFAWKSFFRKDAEYMLVHIDDYF